MKAYPYLFCGNGIFNFRKLIPNDLKYILGKREFVKSLKTTNSKLARRRSIEMADDLDELFTKIRSGAKLLSPSDVVLLSKAMSQSETESLIVEALEDFKHRTREDEEWEAFHAREYRAQVLEALQDSRFEMAYPRVDKFLLSNDLLVSPNTATYIQLCRAALKALAETYENAELIVKGDFENPKLHVKTLEAVTTSPLVIEQAEGQLRFGQVIKQYLNDHMPTWGAKQYNSQKAKLYYFLEYLENEDGLPSSERTLESVTNGLARQYKEHLQVSPTNAKQKYPELSPQESVIAAKQDKSKTLGLTSQNNYLQCLSTLYTFAAKELDYEGKNPFKGRSNTKAAKKDQRDKRNPLSRDHLKRLFASPIYTGCKSLASCYKEGSLIPKKSHKYWTPLIGLYTGMRMQEILQLYVVDVYQTSGIWVFDLNANHKDQKLKTSQSKRLVPIHTDLIDLGLLDFLRSKETERLFNDAPLGSDNTYSSTYSKWFSRYIQKINIKTDKTSFHSLRHNLKDFFRQVGESDELVENLVGRTTGSTGEAYGSGYSIERFNEAIHKINFRDEIPSLFTQPHKA